MVSQEGDPRHGTADDPRMVPIGVDVHGAAVFLEIDKPHGIDKPQPVVLFELVEGWRTGSTTALGETHRVRT